MARLGLDSFSLRNLHLSPEAALDFAAANGFEGMQFSNIFTDIPNREDDALERIRRHADDLGLALEVGILSCCSLSIIFDAQYGTPEDQLVEALRVAEALGAGVIRCVLGTWRDRIGETSLQLKIDEMARTLTRLSPLAAELGVRFAIENHAGDLTSHELRQLIEKIGSDAVGACIDTANALWVLEDPHAVAETLAPVAVTMHMRDGQAQLTPVGVEVSWTPIGRGRVEWETLLGVVAVANPDIQLNVEVISGGMFRAFDFSDPSLWERKTGVSAAEFARFVRFAHDTQRYEPELLVIRPPEDLSADRETLLREQQLLDIAISAQHSRRVLGLGRATD